MLEDLEVNQINIEYLSEYVVEETDSESEYESETENTDALISLNAPSIVQPGGGIQHNLVSYLNKSSYLLKAFNVKPDY